jgi:uncharacterized protein
MTPVLLIPGICNSGPSHWQSLWQARHPGLSRLAQRDWDHPDCDEWASVLDSAVRNAAQPPLLVAHSLGCLVVARWAAQSPLPVHAILLVAVPDPAGPAFPTEATGFSALPGELPGRRITMVSSTNDPYSTPPYSQRVAQAWNAEHICLGALGHINAASGLHDWPAGWALAEKLRSALPLLHHAGVNEDGIASQ